ncbi:MAG: hypothetical protein EOP08_14520 [Proteobacteria bacterium]|nr:MAG: hypothetical protein EOP08_14520 [Pseudomonadota bacterium]
MAPPQSEKRSTQMARFILATPPDEAGFEAMGPTAAERESFTTVLRLRREEPDHPALVKLQRKLDELDAVRITFEAERMIVTTSDGTDVSHYRVEEELGDRLVVIEEASSLKPEKRVPVAFDGNDALVLTIGASRVPMVRSTGRGTPVPSAVPPATRAALSARASSPESPSMPASGNAEYDACVASYYRCIDQLQPADRAAMAETIAYTRKMFADAAHDPSRMQSTLASCKQAVALGKASFCR